MSETRRLQIIKEATDLFGQLGFDKVTINSLARACHVTEPALYRYFKSKEAIYEAVLDSLTNRMICQSLFDRLETVDDLEEILFETAEHIIKFFKNNHDLYRLMLFSALREHTKARQVFRTVRGPYVKFLILKLNKLYEAGIIRKKNNIITARCFIGMVFDCAMGISLWKGFQGRSYTPLDMISNNVPIYVRGLLIKPPKA